MYDCIPSDVHTSFGADFNALSIIYNNNIAWVYAFFAATETCVFYYFNWHPIVTM